MLAEDGRMARHVAGTAGRGDRLTFRAMQKYEREVNRVSASRLFNLSCVLDVPISFFFGDPPDAQAAACGAQPSRPVAGFVEAQEGFGDDTLNRRETLELVPAYYRITDASVRKRVLELIKAVGPEGWAKKLRSRWTSFRAQDQ